MKERREKDRKPFIKTDRLVHDIVKSYFMNEIERDKRLKENNGESDALTC